MYSGCMPSRDEISDDQTREGQKIFMKDVLIPYVKNLGYVDAGKPESFSDRLYEMTGVEESLLSEKSPGVFLAKYGNKVNPEPKIKGNYMSVALRGAVRGDCYVSSSNISIFINAGDKVEIEHLDVPFEFKVFGSKNRKDVWSDERKFIDKWISYFDNLPVV